MEEVIQCAIEKLSLRFGRESRRRLIFESFERRELLVHVDLHPCFQDPSQPLQPISYFKTRRFQDRRHLLLSMPLHFEEADLRQLSW